MCTDLKNQWQQGWSSLHDFIRNFTQIVCIRKLKTNYLLTVVHLLGFTQHYDHKHEP